MTDSLIIKDGSGNIKSLTVESGSYGYIPVHTLSSSAGSGSYVTASATYPVYVTGNVSISQPVNVDVVVGDNIAVTSSLAAPLYVSSSANSPLLVTGTLTVNTASSVSISNSSLSVTASQTDPVYVTGAVEVNNVLTANPSKAVSSTIGFITSSYFTWTGNTGSDGMYNFSPSNPAVKGLILVNPGPNTVYVAIGGGGSQNGFLITNTASAPNYCSLVLYPSGTYVADPISCVLQHSVYYISGAVNPTLYYTIVL